MNKIFNTVKRGFTLVELLIVIIIIAVLAGIVLIALNPAEQRARATATALKSNTTAVCRAQAVCLVEADLGGEACETFAQIQIADPYPIAGTPDIVIDGDAADDYVITGTYDGTTDFTFSCQNVNPANNANFGRTDCNAVNGSYDCAMFNLQ